MSAALAKRVAGGVVRAANPQCRYDRAVFLLGHMRCGSTALSHVLCGHPAVSGYGEAHIAYGPRGALGVLALNQWRRGAWKPRARYLFDKILHGRYDSAADAAFFGARAIFLVREPRESILSIRKLFAAIGSREYDSDESAADYYEARIEQLHGMWERFAPDRRLGVSYSIMTENPNAVLQSASALLKLTPPLANRYERPAKVMARGAGDPLSSHRFNGIVSSRQSSTLAGLERELAIPSDTLARLDQLYLRTCDLFS